jgi:hypothetical protein
MAIWTKQGVVITPNTHDLNGGGALSGTEEPNVLYEGSPKILSANPDGKVFKMWFTGGNDLCYAESNDGLAWTPYTGTSNGVVISNMVHGRLFKNSGTYYYYGNPGPAGVGQIDCWSSADGVTSWSLAKASALTAGAHGTYDASISQLNPIYVSAGTWYALYSCCSDYTGNGIWKAAQATSTDGLNWSKYGGVVTNISNVNAVNVGGTYYGWGQMETMGTTTSVPTDIFRMQFTDATLTATVASSYNEVFPRTSSSEGFGSANGQVADPAMVEVNGKVYCYYTATATGNSGTGYTLQCATSDLTFAQLVATNEGIILPNLLFMQDNQGQSASSPLAVAYLNNTVGNSLLLVQLSYYGTSSPSLTSLKDDLGNNFTQIGTWHGFPDNTYLWGLFYLRNATAGGARTITFIGANISFCTMALSEYIGQADSPIDTSALVYQATPSTTLTTPNIVTTFPNETIFAAASWNTPEQTASAASPFTIRNSNSGQYQASSDANETATGTYGTSFTVGTGALYMAGTVGVKSGLSDPQTYEITGNVGVAGATISWTGGSTTADSSGNYNTGPLANGSYILTPSKTGYTFSPTSAAETVSGADITGVNFAGQLLNAVQIVVIDY